MHARLEQRLAQRRADGLYRELRMHEAGQGAVLLAEGKARVNFCSNDYLGLAADLRLAAAMAEGARTYGVGAGAAHLVCGHSRAHAEVEAAMADWLGREQALLFSSGWLANLAAMTALLHPGDAVLQDRLNHASLLDGAKLAQARSRRYAHVDMVDLLQQLESRSTALVVTDAVFSMDGDVAPLAEIASLCKQQGAWLMADDAHGLGVLGDEGQGCAAGLDA
ncbi:MAG: aminotransferase class I/II-fold pyridoxal phosphate-dependent enzyme, partial [Pseudomonadales bacterium]|nr:aminotransferase class I/II-fold pyridoxal phosphate-dependent enzyme [Pseudomonadales bacterium]